MKSRKGVLKKLWGFVFLSWCLSLCQLGAQGNYIVVDAHSGKVLLENGADQRLGEVGLTKLTTAVVVFDWAKLSGTDLATMILVPNSLSGGTNPMGLRPGDQISIRDALYSMLMSADDVAATTLGTFVGYSVQQKNGGRGVPIQVFVNEMNQLARWLGMAGTRFYSENGVAKRQQNTSTVRDLARVSIYASRHKAMAFFVKQQKRTISYVRAGKKVSFAITNKNTLIGRQGVNGLTVGGAGVIAVHAEKKAVVTKLADGRNQIYPRELVVILVGSPNAAGQATALLNQGWPALDGWRQQGMPVRDRVRDLLAVPNPK